MFAERNSIEKVTEMGCCGCFGFSFVRTPKKVIRPSAATRNNTSREFLLNDDLEDHQNRKFHHNGITGIGDGEDFDFRSPTRRSEEILMSRTQHGLICREFPVKETPSVLRSVVSSYI